MNDVEQSLHPIDDTSRFEKVWSLCELSIDGKFDDYFVKNFRVIDCKGALYFHDKTTDLVLRHELVFCIKSSPMSVVGFLPYDIGRLYEFLNGTKLF